MFAKSVAEFLQNNGFGEIDKDIFINTFPSRANMPNAICVFDTYSYKIRGRARNSASFNCRIQVRNAKASKASEIAFDMYNLFEKGSIYDNNNKRFMTRPLNPPNFYKFDDANRANWMLNVTGVTHNY